jgi:soluble lytic murein transglycosylase-like protein
MRYLPLLWLFAASWLLAEDPYEVRFAELRQRIANGGDVGQLLNQWEGAKSSPPLSGSASNGARMSYGRTNPGRPDLSFNRPGFPILDVARDKVRVAACQSGVHPSLALAIVDYETGFNNRARGEKGEIGAGQIMPATAMKFGFDTRRLATDYDYNIQSSVGIMRYLLDYFGGDEQAAIRGYNGGPGWQNAGPAARGQIEHYAATVSGLRSKYGPVTCG